MFGFIKVLRYSFLIFILSACSIKEPNISQSATILIKTPTMKFYDKGFISKFDNYTQVQIFSAGTSILNLKIYEDRVCQSSFECVTLEKFNRQNLNSSYPKNFIKELFDANDKKTVYKDKKNSILIKITKD